MDDLFDIIFSSKVDYISIPHKIFHNLKGFDWTLNNKANILRTW
jgi:hypothetical protein